MFEPHSCFHKSHIWLLHHLLYLVSNIIYVRTDPWGWWSSLTIWYFSNRLKSPTSPTTVDGRHPAPVDKDNISLFTGFHTCQVVQDFSHQQYDYIMLISIHGFRKILPFNVYLDPRIRWSSGQQPSVTTQANLQWAEPPTKDPWNWC